MQTAEREFNNKPGPSFSSHWIQVLGLAMSLLQENAGAPGGTWGVGVVRGALGRPREVWLGPQPVIGQIRISAISCSRKNLCKATACNRGLASEPLGPQTACVAWPRKPWASFAHFRESWAGRRESDVTRRPWSLSDCQPLGSSPHSWQTSTEAGRVMV